MQLIWFPLAPSGLRVKFLLCKVKGFMPGFLQLLAQAFSLRQTVAPPGLLTHRTPLPENSVFTAFNL